MHAMAYSTARKHLVETMKRVCDNHEPVIITRKNAASVVMMSLEDYNAIEETDYLLRNPHNAQALRASIKQYEDGRCQNRGLIEE
jgi:antitoxin YefM